MTKRLLVLLVDEDDVLRAAYSKALQDAGCETVTAGSGEMAFRLALTAQPDAIVTELALRPHDGWALLRALKADQLTRHIPVVVLTADGEDDIHTLVEEAQGAAYLSKPCPPEAIVLELFLVLAGRPNLH